jgi:hypothetical protein
MTTIYLLSCGYTKLGRAYTPSSAPTISVADSNNNLLVNAAATTARSVLTGVFDYSYSGADGLNLIGLWTTSDTTVDQQDLHSHPYDAVILKAIADLPTAAEIDTQLSGTHGAGTWGNGSGSTSTTVTVNDGVNPIDGVDVWISTDSAGTNVVARGSTGALGTVVFMLDAGTYYAWKQLAGYDFTNPQSFTVS